MYTICKLVFTFRKKIYSIAETYKTVCYNVIVVLTVGEKKNLAKMVIYCT